MFAVKWGEKLSLFGVCLLLDDMHTFLHTYGCSSFAKSPPGCCRQIHSIADAHRRVAMIGFNKLKNKLISKKHVNEMKSNGGNRFVDIIFFKLLLKLGIVYQKKCKCCVIKKMNVLIKANTSSAWSF